MNVKNTDFQKESNLRPILEVKKLSKVFSGNRGIKNVDFSIPRGSFTVLIGENGAGKTTLIRCILRIYQQFSGQILINNFGNDDINAFQSVGYISETSLFPNDFNVFEYLMWVARFQGYDENRCKSIVQEQLASLGITKFAKANPNK